MWIKLFWLEIELEPEELSEVLRHLAILAAFNFAAPISALFKSARLSAVLRVIGIVLATSANNVQTNGQQTSPATS